MTPDQERLAGGLLSRAREGDNRAYDELLRLLAREARSFVGRRVSWADWTEDVVQEVLLTVHRARRSYDASRPFGPWFYAIVNSRLIDTLRSRKRVTTREVLDEDVLAVEPAPEQAGPGTDVREALARAVAALPRVQREVVSLMKYDDLSVREIATRLGMSEAAVKASAHRGYKGLRASVGGLLVENRRPD